MGCSENLVKYILFIVNLFFALGGLALLGLGVAVELKVASVRDLLEENQLLRMTPISAMVLGGVVFVIAFFGCCGAVKESNCMLLTYSILMLVLMILKITLVVLIFVKWETILKEIPHWLQMVFEADRKAFHELERTFHCCGLSRTTSYEISKNRRCTSSYAYLGCDIMIEILFSYYGKTVGALAIVVVAVELVLVVFAMCLANHVRERSRGQYC